MKYVYEATYKNWDSAPEKIKRVVASSIDRAIIAARKAIKKEEYSVKEILSITRGIKIDAVE